MPTYAWKGKTRTGEMREGTMQASSRAEAIAALRRQGVTQATVAERGKELALPKLRGSAPSSGASPRW